MAESTNPPFLARRRLHLLIILFAVITIVGGAEPTDRTEWWEGNIGIIAMLVILTVSYRWWPLSDLSYILLLTPIVNSLGWQHASATIHLCNSLQSTGW